jgi:BlaI family penicillinase repressor
MGRPKKARKGRRAKVPEELTEAEWAIMKVVWGEEPCTAGTVQETLADTKDWAYSTVKTTMDRMADKGFLVVERMRNLQLFRSSISEVEAKRAEFRRMLKRAFDGALTPMMQFLIEQGGLSRDEAAQLRQLVRKTEADKE